MDAGLSYLVSVTMQNNGSNTWTQAENYRLGSQNPQDNYTWELNRVDLPASVPPGGQVTFSLYVTAPYNSGTYNFQWRMVQDGIEWFGDATPNLQIMCMPIPRVIHTRSRAAGTVVAHGMPAHASATAPVVAAAVMERTHDLHAVVLIGNQKPCNHS